VRLRHVVVAVGGGGQQRFVEVVAVGVRRRQDRVGAGPVPVGVLKAAFGAVTVAVDAVSRVVLGPGVDRLAAVVTVGAVRDEPGLRNTPLPATSARSTAAPKVSPAAAPWSTTAGGV
jgi:hypothetical protein